MSIIHSSTRSTTKKVSFFNSIATPQSWRLYLLIFAISLNVPTVFADNQSSPKQSRYSHLEKIEGSGQGVAMIHPTIDSFGFDAVRMAEANISYRDKIKPLSTKAENKIKQALIKSERDWLMKGGANVVENSSACVLDFVIKIADVEYDKSRLKNSSKFRYRVYGSALVSVELQHPKTQEPIFLWAKRIPLATKQSDKGAPERKITRSLQRNTIESFDQGFEGLVPKAREFAMQSQAHEGCKGELAKWLTK